MGERADLVERAGERDQAVAADAAIGRLEADHAAKRRRLADRAAGVGAERQRDQSGRDRRGRATRGAARHARLVPGVQGRSVSAVLGRRAHRELVHVRLAEQDRAGSPELGDHRGVVRRAEVLAASGCAQVVGSPSTQSTSLIATGTPASGPSGSPAFRCGDRRPSPGESTRSGSRWTKTLSRLVRSARSRSVPTISSDVSSSGFELGQQADAQSSCHRSSIGVLSRLAWECSRHYRNRSFENGGHQEASRLRSGALARPARGRAPGRERRRGTRCAPRCRGPGAPRRWCPAPEAARRSRRSS